MNTKVTTARVNVKAANSASSSVDVSVMRFFSRFISVITNFIRRNTSSVTIEDVYDFQTISVVSTAADQLSVQTYSISELQNFLQTLPDFHQKIYTDYITGFAIKEISQRHSIKSSEIRKIVRTIQRKLS